MKTSTFLLLLTDIGAQTPDNPIHVVPPFGLQFKIDEPVAAQWRLRMGQPDENLRRRISILRNEYIRFMIGFDLTYNLGHKGIFRCDVLDPRVDAINAYRPEEDQEIIVQLSDGTPIFRGRIQQTEERALQEPNFGTVTSIQAIDYSEAAEHTFADATFGTDPRVISAVIAGNPATVITSEPHGFTTGNTVTIEGVSGAVPDVTGNHVVTVLDATTFTISVAVTSAGNGGTARWREYLQPIIQYLASLLEGHDITLDPTMEQGPLVEKIVFDGSVQDGLSTLTKSTGWVHRFLPTKMLQVYQPGTKDAPFILNGDAVVSGFRKAKTRASFANIIRLSYGNNSVVDKTEVFTANGTNRVFPLSYKPNTDTSTRSPGHVIDYAHGGAIRHVGVWGYDTLFEWVYRKSDNSLVQLAEAPPGFPVAPRPAGTQIGFTYAVQFPQIVEEKNQASIDARGPYTRRVEAPDIFDIAPARQRAQQILFQAVANPRRATVPTRTGLVFPGTTVEINLPHRQITSDEWLVTSVTCTEQRDGSLHFLYNLIEDNKLQPGWIDFLKGLTGSSGSGGGTSVAAPPPSGVLSGVAGAGTTGFLAAWAAPTTLGDSVLQQSAEAVFPQNPYGIDIGRFDKKFRAIHAGELVVETLVAQDTIATIGGSILVAPTTILEKDFAPTETIITVKHNDFRIGDRLLLKRNSQLEMIGVLSLPAGTGPYTMEVLRNMDGTGANTWVAGDAIVNTAVFPGESAFIDIYARRGTKSSTEIGPTLVGNVRNSSVWNDWSPRWAIGNLNGLYDYSANVYGAAFGVPINSGTGPWLTVDAINGVRAGYGPSVNFHITAGGSATFVGNVSAGSGFIGGWTIQSPYIYSGSTSSTRAVVSADGGHFLWAGHFNVGEAPFRVTSAGVLHATGAVISGSVVSGSITVTGGNAAKTDLSNVTTIDGSKITTGTLHANRIIGGTITADKLNVGSLSAISADLGAVTAGQVVIGGGNKIWINENNDGDLAVGGSNKNSAPFYVSETGDVNIVNLGIQFGGTVNFAHMAGGGDRFVKVNNLGTLFASA